MQTTLKPIDYIPIDALCKCIDHIDTRAKQAQNIEDYIQLER